MIALKILSLIGILLMAAVIYKLIRNYSDRR